MMSAHTSFKIGGPADLFVSVKSSNEAADLIRLANELDVPYMIMGNGSNMLVGDGGIRGLVIQIGKNLSDITVSGDMITAEAGAMMSKVAAEAMRASLSGFEEISGIPGTVGGAVFMNAGAYGGEISDIVKTVTYIDDKGDMHTIQGHDCCFGYRRSIFSDGGKYIVSVTFGMKHGNIDEIRSAMDEYSRRRSEKTAAFKTVCRQYI